MKPKYILLFIFGLICSGLLKAQSQVSFSPSSLTWDAGDISPKYATVYVSGGGSWQCDSTIYSNHFSISPRFGSSGASICVTPLSANTRGEDIEGGVDASGGSGYGILWLLHKAEVPELSVSPSSLSWMWNVSSPKTVYVTAASGSWTVSLVGNGFSVTKNGNSVTVTPADENTAGTARTASLLLSSGSSSATISLTQGANPYVSGLTTTNYIQRTVFTNQAGLSYFRDVTYYDGLGFEVQSIEVGDSPYNKSVVRETVYDNMKRPDARYYLPYARNNGSASKTSRWESLYAQAAYHGNIHADAHPYEQKEYGESPAGRVKSSRKAGDAWADGSGKTVNIGYTGNTPEDAVLHLRYVVEAGNAAAVRCDTVSQYYKDGRLRRIRLTDEEGSVSDTFYDGAGRTICVRRWSGANGSGTACDTYYVYDLRDSLALVLQPEGAAALLAKSASQRIISLFNSAASPENTSNIFRDWCFAYEYDGFGNLIREHVPGGGTTQHIYDIRNREVLRTDSAMTGVDSTAYIRTEYDDYNRMVRRSVVRTDADAATLRTQVCAAVGLPASVTAAIAEVCVLYEAEYYPYLNYYTYPNTGWDAFCAESGVVSASDLETSKIKGMLKSETLYPAAGADGDAPQQGVPTLSRRYHYDKYGRVIQVVESGSDGWTARYSTKYDFVGNVLATKETHTSPDSGIHYILTTNSYDPRGRLLYSSRTVDNNALSPVIYSYDELGRLCGKTFYDAADHSLTVGIETRTYDIHDWTTGINASAAGSPVFSESLRYSSPSRSGTAARFDGNVAEITFGTFSYAGQPESSTYGYSYDGLGRLTDAAFYGGSSNSQSFLKTEKGISYDRNGNIAGLNRYGASGLCEMLSFSHSGNLLTSMQSWDGEGLPAASTFCYDSMGRMTSDSSKGLQFCYNMLNLPSKVEGMAGSANAGLTLNYGYLSDGTKVSALLPDGDGLRYRGNFVYEATAEPVDWYDDMGNHVTDPILWESISSIGWTEGRIVFTNPFAVEIAVDSLALDEPWIEAGLAADILAHGVIEPVDSMSVANIVGEMHDEWHVMDHLGSTRAVVSLNHAGTVLETCEYLPFGTCTEGSFEASENRYRFGGKEQQHFGFDIATGQQKADLAQLDFGARFYDPRTCRWTSPDPLAGKYPGISPYAYCLNDPVGKLDPDGSVVETIFDAASLVLGVKSFASNVKQGRIGAAAVDGIGIVADAFAVATPFIPGGAGAAIKAVRAGDKAVDAIKAVNRVDDVADAAKGASRLNGMQRGVRNEAKTLEVLGESKNTKKFTKKLDDGSLKTAIPDFVNSNTVGEIKDAKVVNNTRQIRAERKAAKDVGKEFKIYTGTKTHVSGGIPDSEIERLPWLGPQY